MCRDRPTQSCDFTLLVGRTLEDVYCAPPLRATIVIATSIVYVLQYIEYSYYNTKQGRISLKLEFQAVGRANSLRLVRPWRSEPRLLGSEHGYIIS